jgi:L-iditol 2-dehydrogenase
MVCGAGPIGLLTLAAARASGAHPIVISDLEPTRLAFAKELVPACKTYQIDRDLTIEENAKKIRKLFGEEEYVQPRLVLECTGVESSVCTAAFVARRGGVVMVVGVGRSVMNNLPFMHLSLAEVSLKRSQFVPVMETKVLLTNNFATDRFAVHQPLPRHMAGRYSLC